MPHSIRYKQVIIKPFILNNFTAPKPHKDHPFFTPKIDIKFLLVTNSNPNDPQEITWDSDVFANSNFNKSNPVRVLIHGFRADTSCDLFKYSTDAWLKFGEFNIIWVRL